MFLDPYSVECYDQGKPHKEPTPWGGGAQLTNLIDSPQIKNEFFK